MHLCIECSLFELYEYDEIGDHDGDGGGDSGPVHVEQPVTRYSPFENTSI